MLNLVAEEHIDITDSMDAPLMKGEILVESGRFMDQLEVDLESATESVFVQAMSFEGDDAGHRLIDAMLTSKAKDKRICIDSYSKAVINDHFIHSTRYLTSSSFRNEVRETKRLIAHAKKSGIQIHFTNSLGFLMHKYPLRNHKKMVVIDGQISYIGGINFTDHNFEWHDFMLRVDSHQVGHLMSGDFNHTFYDQNQSVMHNVEDGELYFFDGYRSRGLYDQLFSHLKQAKKQIQILSPYVSNPLLGYIEKYVDGNVDVQIVTPGLNNKSIFKDYLINELEKKYFRLFELPDIMSHLKSILIDGEKLILGSSNFDFASYYLEQEVVMITWNKQIVEDYTKKILEPDTQNSIEVFPTGNTENSTNSRKIKIAEAGCSRIGKMAYKRYK